MNFSEMQENLSNWISEDKDTDGTWTIAEKERQLNDGVLEFVKKTKFLQDIQRLKSIEDQVEYPLPEDYMNSILLLANKIKYRRETLENHFLITNGGEDNVAGPYAYYYLDKVRNTFKINPSIADDGKDIKLLYIRRPKELVDLKDIPVIPKEFHMVPVYWAAYQLLPKEFEQGRRGREALAAWKGGIAEALEFINHEVDDSVSQGTLGPEFRSHGGRLGRADFDLFTTGGS